MRERDEERRRPGSGSGAERRDPPPKGASRPRRPIPTHLRPRTGAGWVAVILFVVLMALAQPPVVHGLANRIEPWVLGMPFLFAYLLAVYAALVGLLLWAMRRRL